LHEATFEMCCVEPVAEIGRRVREVQPNTPIIGFPKGAGALYQHYRQKTGVTALGLDCSVPWSQARALQKDGAVQGNLDPMRPVAGGQALDEGVTAILRELAEGPLVFNLGHGITPQTPIAHVERMIELVREG